MIVIPFAQEAQTIPTEGLLYWQDFTVPNCHVTGSLRTSDLTNTAVTGSFFNAPAYSFVSASMQFYGNVRNTYIGTNFLRAVNDATVICIYKSLSITGTYERLVDRNFSTGFWLGRDSNTANRWGGGFIRPTSPYGIYDNGFTDGQWHMIGISRSGSTQRLWNKGTVVQTATGLSTAATNANAIFFGTEPGVVTYGLNGFLGMVMMYSRELTAAEMTQIFQYYNLRYQF